MTTPTVHLYKPAGPDRLAVLAVEPADRPGTFLLRLARGPRLGQLTEGGLYGPYQRDEMERQRQTLVEALHDQGYLPGGAHAALAALGSPDPAVRGRAAVRLGWVGGEAAVAALLAALPKAVDEACAIIDALGRCGDRRAVPALRPYAERKLLSRRRSAVEALRRLDDRPGLAAAGERCLAQLPEPLREALAADDPAALHQALLAEEKKRLGLYCDLLYELDRPAACRAALAVLEELDFAQPFVWRYVKSVFKRALLRDDYATSGWLCHQIERRGRSTPGGRASVKSGYDGALRETTIFSRRTRNYLRRAAWRYLRRLARYRPQDYPAAAAEALLHYGPPDSATPQGRYGALADCYLFNRILYGAGDRLVLCNRSLKHRLQTGRPQRPVDGAREEPFAELWDAQPRVYLRLLAAARLIEVQEFALLAVQQRHPELLDEIDLSLLLPLLGAVYEPTVTLALLTLERRFDPHRPDRDVLLATAAHPLAAARRLAQRWLREGLNRWAGDPLLSADLLSLDAADSRLLCAELLPGAPALTDTALRRRLAEQLLQRLQRLPAERAESVARVCREALLVELATLLPTDRLLALLDHPSSATQTVVAALLAERPQAVEQLGLDGLQRLVNHPLAVLRGAAGTLLRDAESLWLNDPAPLLVLAESDWPDGRELALNLLEQRFRRRAITPSLNQITALLDSAWRDVRDYGRQLAARQLSSIDGAELLRRLAQHPQPDIRRYALQLAVDSAAPLTELEPLCRAILFDTQPERTLRRALVELLIERGLRDPVQGALAVELLGELLRLQTRTDFETALTGLTRLRLAHPQLANPVAVA